MTEITRRTLLASTAMGAAAAALPFGLAAASDHAHGFSSCADHAGRAEALFEMLREPGISPEHRLARLQSASCGQCGEHFGAATIGFAAQRAA